MANALEDGARKEFLFVLILDVNELLVELNVNRSLIAEKDMMVFDDEFTISNQTTNRRFGKGLIFA